MPDTHRAVAGLSPLAARWELELRSKPDIIGSAVRMKEQMRVVTGQLCFFSLEPVFYHSCCSC